MRGFVIGNGPSLNDTPLDLLRDENTIGINRLYLAELDWDPTFWLAVDIGDHKEWPWEDLLTHDSHFIMDEHMHSMMLEHTNRLDRLNITWISRCVHESDHDEWKWHLPYPCWRGGAASIGLQLAVLQGWNPIYLVGCDLYEYRGPGPDINHFHPEYSEYKIRKSTGKEVVPPENWEHLNNRLVRAHQMCKESMQAMGVTVYNATVGGKLEVYPRADIRQVLSGT